MPTIAVPVGPLALQGQAPVLSHVIPVGVKGLVLGSALVHHHTPGVAALVLKGLEPDLDPSIETPPQAELAFAGQAPALLVGALPVPVGTLALAGLAPGRVSNADYIPPIGPLAFTGHAPVLPLTDETPGVAALVFTGHAPVIGRPSAPAAGPLVLAGLVPTIVSTGFFFPSAALVLAGLAPEIVSPFLPGAAALLLEGHAPSAGIPPAQLLLRGLAPSLTAPIITVPAGALVLQGFIDPIFNSGNLNTTAATFSTRRVRETPYLTEEQVWVFFSRLQVYLEVGVGLEGGSTVQGHDPQVMLQWSDNNGRTWSQERWVSAGKHGKYRQRALWRRLGRSRKRLFRIAISDPVRVRLIDAYLDLTKGTS